MSNYYRSITKKPNNRQIPNRLLIVNHPKWQQWMPFVCCLFSKTARKCHTTTEQQTRRDHTHQKHVEVVGKGFLTGTEWRLNDGLCAIETKKPFQFIYNSLHVKFWYNCWPHKSTRSAHSYPNFSRKIDKTSASNSSSSTLDWEPLRMLVKMFIAKHKSSSGTSVPFSKMWNQLPNTQQQQQHCSCSWEREKCV